MSWISIAAIYFIIWWMVLFAMLPFGLRTQDDDAMSHARHSVQRPARTAYVAGRFPHDDCLG